MNRAFYNLTLSLTDLEWLVFVLVLLGLHCCLEYWTAYAAVKKMLAVHSRLPARKVEQYAAEAGWSRIFYIPRKIKAWMRKQ